MFTFPLGSVQLLTSSVSEFVELIWIEPTGIELSWLTVCWHDLSSEFGMSWSWNLPGIEIGILLNHSPNKSEGPVQFPQQKCKNTITGKTSNFWEIIHSFIVSFFCYPYLPFAKVQISLISSWFCLRKLLFPFQALPDNNTSDAMMMMLLLI